jgi:hypothetical protein
LKTLPAANCDRFHLIQAARWPDDIRDNPTYHHSLWHYIDNPLIAKGDEGKVNPPPSETPNILTALTPAHRTRLSRVRGATWSATILLRMIRVRGVPPREARRNAGPTIALSGSARSLR